MDKAVPIVRQEHLIKSIRYWLARASDKLDKGYVAHGKAAVDQAKAAVDELELSLIQGS